MIGIFGAGFFFLISKSISNFKKEKFIRSETVEIPDDLPEGFSFFNQVIIFKENSIFKAYSSKCPHLGCIINKNIDKVLVCTCHGSEFSSEGKVISGPATKNLKILKTKEQSNKIIVYLESDD